MDFYKQYKKELEAVLDDEEEISFFCNMLNNKFTQNMSEFNYINDNITEFTDKHKLQLAKAWINNYKCWCYYESSQYDKAIELALESYKVLEGYNCKQGMARLCNSLMAFYTQIGKIELSNEWGIRGVLMAEELKDDELFLVMLLNVCVGYIELGQYEKSEDILGMIKNKKIKIPNERMIAYLQCVVEVDIFRNKPNNALSEIKKIYNLGSNIFTNYYESETIKLEAMAYSKLGKYNIAEDLFNKSYCLSLLHNNANSTCLTLYRWAEFYASNNKDDKALEKFTQLLEYAEKYKYTSLQYKSYKILYSIYKRNNCSDKALEYLEKFTTISNNINSVENNQWLTKFNVSHIEREAAAYKILYDKTELLSTIGMDILSNLDESVILSGLTKEVRKLMRTDTFSIIIYDEEKNEIYYKYIDQSHNGMIVEAGPYKMVDDKYLAEYCIRKGRDILITNYAKEFKLYSKASSYIGKVTHKSIMFTPMFVKGKITGAITTQAAPKNAYTKNDLNTLKILSNYVGIALYNANLYKDLENKVIYDNLTGILNRSEVIRYGEIALENYNTKDENLTIAMIDIDKLKFVNDNYGHVMGDKIICIIAQKISENIFETDYVGRYGGDEFLVVFTDTIAQQAKLRAERVRKIVYDETKKIIKNDSDQVSISIGLYQFKKNETFMSGVHKADIALYDAKHCLGNSVVINIEKNLSSEE